MFQNGAFLLLRAFPPFPNSSSFQVLTVGKQRFTLICSLEHAGINLRWGRNENRSRVLNVHGVQGPVNKPSLE